MKLEIKKFFNLAKATALTEIRGGAFLKISMILAALVVFVVYLVNLMIPAPSFQADRFFIWYWLTSICIIQIILVYQINRTELKSLLQLLIINGYGSNQLTLFYSSYFFLVSIIFEAIVTFLPQTFMEGLPTADLISILVTSSLIFSQILLYVVTNKTTIFPLAILILGFNLVVSFNLVEKTNYTFNLLAIFLSLVLYKLNHDSIRVLG